MTKQLSPAAEAVLDAAYEVRPWMVRADSGDIAAAALRAAADQVVPDEKTGGRMFAWQHERLAQRLITRDCILAIAAELEGAQ